MNKLVRQRTAFVATATVHARRMDDYDIVVAGGEFAPEHEVMALVIEMVLEELRSGVPIQSFSVKVETRRDL